MRSKKIIYVGNYPTQIKNGGDQINQRNNIILQKIFSRDYQYFNLKTTSSFITFINLICGFMIGSSLYKTIQISKIIQKENIDTVFIGSSKLGLVAFILKKKFKNLDIICFFHNIEKHYMEEECRVNPSLKNSLIKKIICFNEQLMTQVAEKIIVLNQRDEKLLNHFYKRQANCLLPTSFVDTYDINKKQKLNHRGKLKLLFVGSSFFANIEGVKWFINTILSNLTDIQLTIVGNGMDRIFYKSQNIDVEGYVEDLSEYYYQADIVILPIFSGGGMKTKTAEALMYGCPIIGTTEAFEGYEIDSEKIGLCSNDPDEIIKKIKAINTNRELLDIYSKYSREIFSEKYSIKNSESKIIQLF